MHFTLRNCSCLSESQNCDVDVKADLKVACCSLDSKIVWLSFVSTVRGPHLGR